MGQEWLGPSHFFIPLVLGPLNSLVWYIPSLRYTHGLGWRMHCGVEVAESSTNKEHHISGLELDVGSVLLMLTAILMAALHTENFERAKCLLCVTLGHCSVKCVAVSSDVHGESVVMHVHVDVQKMLWLDTLQQIHTIDRPAELPNTDTLVVCFSRRMGSDENGVGFGSEGQHDVLQVP